MASVVNIPITSSPLLSVVNSSQPNFSPLPINDRVFFDEGPRVMNRKKPSKIDEETSMSNLSSSYAYTQGVEINRQSMYDAGLAKIWSGEPGHQMLRAWYGTTGPSISSPFTDDESAYLLDASAIIKSNRQLFPIMLFPIQAAATDTSGTLRYKTTAVRTSQGNVVKYRADQDNAAVVMDGVIESLVIRQQRSMFNSDVPVNPHVPGGSTGMGNQDSGLASDQVLTVDYHNVALEQLPFIDNSQNVTRYSFERNPGSAFPVTSSVTGTPLTSSLTTSITNPVITHVVSEAPFGAFSDTRYIGNAHDPTGGQAVNIDNNWQIDAALSLMTGSTNNYVSFDRRSATCGWSYDNNAAIGTDSLPFGGMTY
jgi:hypothetical protein